MEFTKQDAESFTNLVQHRRSIRKFTGEEVPTNIVDECIDLALLSPNSSNLQPWEFHVIQSADKRKEFIPICLGQNAAKTCGSLIAVVGRRNTWKRHAQQIVESYGEEPPSMIRAYYQKQALFMYDQGQLGLQGKIKKAIITARGLKEAIIREPTTIAEQKTWISKTCAIAAQTYMLAMSSKGYDTCPMEGFDANRAHKALGLPKDAWIVMFIAAGKRTEKGVYGPRFRVPREQVVKYK